MAVFAARWRRAHRYDVAFYLPYVSSLLTPRSAPPGGAESQVTMLACALAAAGLRVALIVYPLPGLPASVDGVDIVTRPRSFTRLRLVGKLLEVVAVFSTVLRLDAEVIVQRAAGFETGLVALAARLRRRRFVYSSANVVDFEFERLEPRRRNVAMFELGVRIADEVVVQTPEQVELCEGRFHRSPVTIKSLAEPAPLRSGEPGAFLWIGRLTDYKRPPEFVELARRMPEARFRMVAVPVGRDAQRLAAEIASAERELENLELLEPRPRAELGELIAEAVAVVNTAEYEGMPNIFLEGWARGVPALALDHDPDGVIERERLGGFAGGSRERLLELAGEMWQSRADQAEVADRCRDYLRREHSPEGCAASWLEVIRGDAR